MLKEVQRVLKEGGIYMIISYGPPENRIFHLEREHLNLDISIYTIKKDYTMDEENQKYEKIHYVYVCKKKSGAEIICKEKFEKVIYELETEEKLEQDYYQYDDGKDEEEDDYIEDDAGVYSDAEIII
jgi:ubiquinone/menaquinone biosynthesis C-methylase UbiE